MLPAPLTKLLRGPVGQGDRLTRDALIALVGRAAGRAAGPAYQLELLDPRHRFGDLLHPLFALWVRAEDPELPGFFAWVDALALELPDGAALFGDDALRRAFAELGVAIDGERAHMLAELWTESALASGAGGVDAVQRVRHRVHVVDGLVTCCGPDHAPEPLDTGPAPGGYLWLLDRWNHLYTAPAACGRSAAPALGRGVRASGAWVVARGHVRELRAQAEHYRTPMRHYVEALRVMRSVLHIPLDEACAGLFRNDAAARPPVSRLDRRVTVGDLLADRDGAQGALTVYPKFGRPPAG